MDSPLVLAVAMAVFLVVFVKTEIGLYLVIFSMLLSPQFGAGGTIAESRRIVVRSEDILLHGRRAELARQDRREQGAGPRGEDAAQPPDPRVRGGDRDRDLDRVRLGHRRRHRRILLRPQVRRVFRRLLHGRQQPGRPPARLAPRHGGVLDGRHRQPDRHDPDPERAAGLGAVRGQGRGAEHVRRLPPAADGGRGRDRARDAAPAHPGDLPRASRSHVDSVHVHALAHVLHRHDSGGGGHGGAVEPASRDDRRAPRPAGRLAARPDALPRDGDEASPLHLRAGARPAHCAGRRRRARPVDVGAPHQHPAGVRGLDAPAHLRLRRDGVRVHGPAVRADAGRDGPRGARDVPRR